MDRYMPGERRRSSRPDTPRVGNADTSLPKNFEKPLTCFFWHQNGRCNKSDEACAYAHWDTGHVAGAPINIPGLLSTGAVAGKNARDLSAAVASPDASVAAADLHVREERLKIWEQELRRWEWSLEDKEEDLMRTTKAKTAELRLRERRVARRERALRKPDRSASDGRMRPSSGS